MRQLIKNFLCMVFLASGLQASWGFALLGPNGNGGDAWQTAVIGYNLLYESFTDIPGGPVFLGDIGGPKNYAEGYRRNAPVLYYAYDQNFATFFGLDGEAAADQAFAIMNSLTNVDSYSSSLSEFPFTSQHFNYTAQSLYLTDIKSVTLHLLVEQLGLAQPERFTWTLAQRSAVAPGVCPIDEIYTVVQRNFDTITVSPTNLIYSPYVNNILYTYWIEEFCTGPNPLALTEPFAVDPVAEQYTAVAANNYSTVVALQSSGLEIESGGGLQIGGFYTGLTRDDVEGLRYLLRTNNINYETPAAGSELLTTNLGSTIIVSNLDLSVLSASALTNDPVTLLTLFPNLLITSVTTNFEDVCTPNVVSYLTNYIGSPVGTAPTFVVLTNGSNCFFQPVYTYSFANVITNTYSTNSHVQLLTTSLGNQISAPVGSPAVTNTITNSIVLNVTSGSYFIIPAGDCGLDIYRTNSGSSGITMTTNILTTATNLSNGFVDSQSIVTIFTNRQYLAYPVICGIGTNATGRYQGIERVQFVRVPDIQVDPLTGNFLQPITNTYTMVILNPTNSQYMTRTFQRVVTRPDILLDANDQSQANTFNGTVQRNINFDQGNVLPGLAGPGVINSPATFSFNKIGLAEQNGPLADLITSALTTPAFLSQITQIPSVAWASFDGSTNVPEMYPNNLSIQNLENQLAVQISPTSLSDGVNNFVYTPVTFTATGGGFVAPFTWSATGLPAGLSIMSNSDNTATLSGTPTQSGTFDFILQLTDSSPSPRTVQWTYSITIQ
jgi:hypothetical protein